MHRPPVPWIHAKSTETSCPANKRLPRSCEFTVTRMHVYEVRPRKDKRGVDLISDGLPFGRLWYAGPNAISNAIGYAKFYSRSHDAVIRVFNERQQRRSATAHARRESLFPELPHAIPIGARGISAQDLNALKEDVGRAVIRT